MKRFRWVLGLALLAAGATALGCRLNRAPALGPSAGKLVPCPASPNCVCSQDPDADHQLAPFTFAGPSTAALAKLRAIVLAEPRTRIIDERDGYFRAAFTSRIFRFVDDVEFLLDGPGKVIHVRSASRVGHSDLGVNRQRVERLRAAFDR